MTVIACFFEYKCVGKTGVKRRFAQRNANSISVLEIFATKAVGFFPWGFYFIPEGSQIHLSRCAFLLENDGGWSSSANDFASDDVFLGKFFDRQYIAKCGKLTWCACDEYMVTFGDLLAYSR